MARKDLEQEIELLREAAKLRAEMSSGFDGYVEGLKKIKALTEEIKRQDEIINKFQAERNSLANSQVQADKDRVKELDKILAILAKEKNLLHKNLDLYKEANKEINKTNILLTKGVGSIIKGLNSFPNLIKRSYGEIKGLGLFEMDKAMKKTALSMGIARGQSQKLRGNIEAAALNTTMFGAGIEELAQYQADYSEELGRSVMLGQKGMESIAAMAKGTTLGAEGAAKMAADFEQQGISAERTKDFVEAAVNKAAKLGLNSSKVIKNMQSNMKLLNKYNFKGGVKGLQKMAETTTKLGIDMNTVGGMAEKLFDIEGAVEMSAQLQVLGGSWAQLGDPFKLMYMARNDMAGLTEEVAKAAASTAVFNKETGQFDISALEMQRLRKVSEATGIAFEDLVTASKNAAKFSKIKGQISFAADKESKQFLENTAQLDEKGRAYIEIKGDKKYLNQLSKQQIKEMMDNKQSLEDRAKDARTFDEALTNMFNLFKQQLLPFIESLEPLVKSMDGFVQTAKSEGWFTTIKEWASKIGEFVASIGKFVLENPKTTLAIMAIPKVLELAFGAYKWFQYGKMLGEGFLSKTGGPGGGGGAGFGTRNMAAMNRAGMSTMGKFGANFKGALRSTGAIAGGVLAGGVEGVSEYSEQKEKGKTTSEAVGRGLLKGAGAGLGAWGGAAAGASLGAFGGPLAPVTVPLGALIGGGLGALGGGYFSDLDTYGVKDGIFGGTQNRAIIQSGKITPIDNKDDILAMKPGGIVDKMMNQNSGSNVVKHEFGELNINGTLVVTTPGNQTMGVDLLRDPMFVSELNQKLAKEIERSINQKNRKG